MNWYKLAISERDLISYLKDNGFTLSRHGGNHDLYCHIEHPEYCIPLGRGHTKEFDKGFIGQIKREINLIKDKIREKEGPKDEPFEVVPEKPFWMNSNWYQKYYEPALAGA